MSDHADTDLLSKILQGGYVVLTAADPDDANDYWHKPHLTIDIDIELTAEEAERIAAFAPKEGT